MGNKERTAGTENNTGTRQEERIYLLQQPLSLLFWQCREAPYFNPVADDPQLSFFFGFWPECCFFVRLIYLKDQTKHIGELT